MNNERASDGQKELQQVTSSVQNRKPMNWLATKKTKTQQIAHAKRGGGAGRSFQPKNNVNKSYDS